MAMSLSTPNAAYTNNDENGILFLVDLTTGNTIGTFSLSGYTEVDPEACSVDMQGRFWLGDLGDNSASRSEVAIYLVGSEPGPGNHGAISATKYRFKYPSGKHNAETLITGKTTSEMYVITKETPSRLYRLPDNLDPSGINVFIDTGINMGDLVSDGAFTPDRRFVLTRRKDENTTVFVHDPAASFAQIDTITVTSQTKPEGITVALDQLSFWGSSEGKFAPLINPAMPSAYQPEAPTPPPSNPCGS